MKLKIKTIEKYDVEYDDDKHKYYVNGNEAVSVTQVLSWKFGTKYDGIDAETLKKAAEYGTNIHNEIEDYEMFAKDGESMEFKNYLWLKKQYKWNVTECEKFIVIPYKDTFICGQCDLLMTISDFNYLVDIKTTCKLDKVWLAYQLNLYKIGLEQTYGTKIDYVAYLWLRSKGNTDIRKFGELAVNQEYAMMLLEEWYESYKEAEQKIIDFFNFDVESE